MFSLPAIAPPDPHSLYYPSLTSHSHHHHQHGSTGTSPPQVPGHHNARHPNSSSAQTSSYPPNPLLTLTMDELAIRTRKNNIARFGAGWLRPPGLSKTLQGMADERLEREEAEAARMREAAAAEEAEAEAEEEMLRAEGHAVIRFGGPDDVGEDAGEERDLDDDVPDADDGEEGVWSSDDDDEDEDDEEDDEDVEYDEDRPAALPPRRIRRPPALPNTTTPVRPNQAPVMLTPTPDRTPQRFRVNPFQSTHEGEGDGDYGPSSPVGRHGRPPFPAAPGPTRRPRTTRERDISPGLVAAGNRAAALDAIRAGQQRRQQEHYLQAQVEPGDYSARNAPSTPHIPETDDMDLDMDMDMDAEADGDDRVAEGSYEHTDTEAEVSSLDGEEGVLGQSVFGGGAGGVGFPPTPADTANTRTSTGGSSRRSGGAVTAGARAGEGGRRSSGNNTTSGAGSEQRRRSGRATRLVQRGRGREN